jgi:hypothetical protein
MLGYVRTSLARFVQVRLGWSTLGQVRFVRPIYFKLVQVRTV